MPSELTSVLINSSGAVATCAMFLWFLVKQSKLEEKKHEQFVKAINGNTNKMGSVEKKVDRIDQKVEKISEEHKEDKEIIRKMYEHAVSVRKGKI